LRHVNSFLLAMGVKYETLKRLQFMSRPGDWAISFDLSDGFHACNIAEDDRKYLTFELQGRLYRAAVLPFGLSSSPAVFCKIMQVLTRLLRSPETALRRDQMSPAHWLALRDRLMRRTPVPYRGMRTLPFMDDYLALFPTRAAALEGREVIDRILDFLGLDRQAAKCVWEPTQTLQHLGFDL
jgi:hypothetical protein